MFAIRHVDQPDYYLTIDSQFGNMPVWASRINTEKFILCRTYQEAFREIKKLGKLLEGSPKCIVKDKITDLLYILLEREETSIRVKLFNIKESEPFTLDITDVEEIF